MEVLAGIALVLITWLLGAVLVLALGSAVAVWTNGATLSPTTIARSAWWGLVILSVAVVGINLWLPLAEPIAVAVVGILAFVSMLLAAVQIRGRNWQVLRRPATANVVTVGVFGASLLFVAAKALGPVTNYDSGLYHLGAIRYAMDYPTIAGLANLHFPFGYANVEFPLAAFFANGLLGDEGFRLLNGFVMALLVVDFALRIMTRRSTPGKYVLAVGMVAAWVPLIALADYWVTSPTQDSAVLLVTVAASAYLVQAIARSHDRTANLAVAGALSVLLVLQRPTMALFAIGVVIVFVALVVRNPRTRAWYRTVASVAGTAVAAGILIAARDRLLSGWLQYPLSVLSFPVEWRSPDPTPFREAILGFHRDPDNMWEASSGWAWVGPWVLRALTQWETYLLLAGLVISVVLVAVAVRAGAGVRWRGLLLSMVPSLLATAGWWTVSPPSYRFAWGPLFTLVTIPIGWLWWRLVRTDSGVLPGPSRLHRRAFAGAVVLPVAAVTVFSVFARTPWDSFTGDRMWAGWISYRVAELPSEPTREVALPTSLTVIQPVEGEQCWIAWPLCTPLIETSVAERGDSVSEGFNDIRIDP